MKKILIVGAQGMLGQALREVLKSYELTAWDRAELDITNAAVVQEKISALRPEVIINAAAYTNVDGAEKDRTAAFTVNADGVKNLAAVAKELGATMVHYSTDYIFPGDREAGYKEDDIPGPAVNVYGESKLAGERALQESGCQYYLIRTAWLYGAGGKNFVDTMLKLGKEPRKTRPAAGPRGAVSVVNDQHGSPTYTQDLAHYTRELLDKNFAPGIYHATNDGAATWFDFAKEIFATTGMQVTVKPVSSAEFLRPAKRPAWSVLLNAKGPKMRSWQEALWEYLTSPLPVRQAGHPSPHLRRGG